MLRLSVTSLRLIALRIVPNSMSESNGLVRNSSAPRLIACTTAGRSTRSERKIIGMSQRSFAMRSCISSPLRSGRLKSRIKQDGIADFGWAKNSVADANDLGLPSSALDHHGQRLSDRDIVIDDEHNWRWRAQHNFTSRQPAKVPGNQSSLVEKARIRVSQLDSYAPYCLM